MTLNDRLLCALCVHIGVCVCVCVFLSLYLCVFNILARVMSYTFMGEKESLWDRKTVYNFDILYGIQTEKDEKRS